MAEAFPPGWMRPEALTAVLRCLRRLPIEPLQKKYALYEWCVTVGVQMEAWMVWYVTGIRPGWI